MPNAPRETKLHELIAALPDRQSAARANVEETTAVFKHKGADLFTGFLKITKSLTEERQTELDAREEKDVVTTVRNRLDYTFALIAKAVDLQLQVDTSNQHAVADLIIGDKVIATGVPGITLLHIENAARKVWMDLVAGAPTLPTGVTWEEDPDKPKNVWRSKHPVERTRTEKQFYPLQLAPATDKHPAQVSKETKDVIIAKTTETSWNGMIPSQEKADILARLQELMIAAQAARQRANETVAKTPTIGAAIVKFIFG
jgi:hypothetical protein